jgi:electron transfer flavoprotein beta subunit
VDIIVCVKTNPDLQMVRIKGREPVLEAVPFKVGDLEKNALEAALQLRDAAGGGTITAVTVSEGDRKIRETMKEALAIGADAAVIVADDGLAGADQTGVALTLAKAVEKAGPFDLLLFGEGSSDGYSGQIPGRVAELLGLPEIGYARKLEVTGAPAGAGADASGGVVRAERSMGDVVEVLEAPLPVAATVVSEINEPHTPSLMHIMKAGKKPVTELTLAELGLSAADVAPRRSVVSNLAEEQARKHVLFEGSPAEQAEALVSALVAEGVVGR